VLAPQREQLLIRGLVSPGLHARWIGGGYQALERRGRLGFGVEWIWTQSPRSGFRRA
jgi:hypothetical protein